MTKHFGRRLAGVLAGLAVAVAVAGPAAAAVAGAGTGASRDSGQVLLGFGDSVAAGYGLQPIATTPYSEACARSTAAYVNKAAAALHLRFANYACSGAVTTDIFLTAQATAGGTVPQQLRQALAGPRPTFTVTSIGANDVKWSYFLAQCLQGNCATDANTVAFDALLAKAKLGLLASVAGEELLRPKRVILAGYYDPFEGNPTAFGLSSANTAWYQARLKDVNDAISATARRFPNATYMPVSLDPTSLTDPAYVQGPLAAGPFHPTDAGQQVIANDLVAVINQAR